METRDSKKTRMRHKSHTLGYRNIHGWDAKSMEKVEAKDVPGLVLPQGPARCPFSISARPKDMRVPRSLQSRSLYAETPRGFQFCKMLSQHKSTVACRSTFQCPKGSPSSAHWVSEAITHPRSTHLKCLSVFGSTYLDHAYGQDERRWCAGSHALRRCC